MIPAVVCFGVALGAGAMTQAAHLAGAEDLAAALAALTMIAAVCGAVLLGTTKGQR